MSKIDLYIVIPAYNEVTRLYKVVDRLKKSGFYNIVVVNDASEDETALSVENDVTLINHYVNLGPGASTMTGIDYCLSKTKAKYIATMDADLQHHPEDLQSLYDKLVEEKLDLLIGSRFLQKNEIPVLRMAYNFVGNIVSFLKSGVMLSDSQSGMKVMSRSFASNLSIDYNGFEFCIDIIKKAKVHNALIGESPINVTYTKETLKKGQSFQNGLLMLFRFMNPFST